MNPSDKPASSPQASVVLHHNAKPGQSLYVEGLSQMLLGFPVSRLLFFSLAERDASNPSAPEMRQIACELIIPTASLIELAQHVLANVASNKAPIEAAKLEWIGKFDGLMSSMPAVTLPVQKS